jgi:hypothetical protein
MYLWTAAKSEQLTSYEKCERLFFCVVGVSIVSLYVFSVVGVSIVSLFVDCVVGVLASMEGPQ